jgi:uncharacterized protein YgbK (DUF1537 family)
VDTSVLGELVPGSVHVTSAGTTRDELVRSIRRRASESTVLTVDATTQDDLRVIAEAVARLGPLAIPAGSAGLAHSLALRWRDEGDLPEIPTQPTTGAARVPTLVLVTSLNRTARNQLRCLTQEFGTRLESIEPELGDLLDEDRFAAWRRDQGRRDVHGHEVVLLTAPEERSSAVSAADLVAHRLADVAADLHGSYDFSAVVVTGGDGARALVKRWRCTGIAVHDALREGMPHGVLVGGEVDGLPIVTKAGGFGDPDSLVLAVRHAQAPDRDSERIR